MDSLFFRCREAHRVAEHILGRAARKEVRLPGEGLFIDGPRATHRRWAMGEEGEFAVSVVTESRAQFTAVETVVLLATSFGRIRTTSRITMSCHVSVGWSAHYDESEKIAASRDIRFALVHEAAKKIRGFARTRMSEEQALVIVDRLLLVAREMRWPQVNLALAADMPRPTEG